jgi:hypothetical protein
MNKQILKEWEDASQKLTDCFIDKYFGKDATYVHWVADEIGGIVNINDYFFDLSNITDFLRCGYSKKEMFGYYNYRTDEGCPTLNIKNWRKLRLNKQPKNGNIQNG